MGYFILIVSLCVILSFALSWPTIVDINSVDTYIPIQNKIAAFFLDKFHDFLVIFLFTLLLVSLYEVFFTQNQFYLTLSILIISFIILLNCKYHKCVLQLVNLKMKTL